MPMMQVIWNFSKSLHNIGNKLIIIGISTYIIYWLLFRLISPLLSDESEDSTRRCSPRREKISVVSPLQMPLRPGNGQLQASDWQAAQNKYESGGTT